MLTFISQAVLFPVLGMCMDKCGRMRTITVYVALTLLSLLMLISRLPWGYHIAFALHGMYGLFIPMIKARLTNECVRPRDRMDTVIVINIASVLFSAVFSLAYGMIAQWTGTYSPLFILTIFIMFIFFPVAWCLYKLLNYHDGQQQSKINFERTG
jgi:MFS family permease